MNVLQLCDSHIITESEFPQWKRLRELSAATSAQRLSESWAAAKVPWCAVGHRANLWQGLVLPLSFLCPQSPLMPVSWRGASALLLHSALQVVISASIVVTSSPCSPMAHNPAEPWCPSHIRAWKGWPVPTVEWTEGSVQTPLPHRRTLLTLTSEPPCPRQWGSSRF